VILQPQIEDTMPAVHRIDTAENEVTVLDSLPGARRLQPDEKPVAGCSALVALEESETLLPARIMEIWDSAYAHVDYSAHGIPRLDEIVELVQLIAVVSFENGSRPLHLSASKHGTSASIPLEQAQNGSSNAQELPTDQPRPTAQDSTDSKLESCPQWTAYQAEFQNTRAVSLINQKNQELARLKVLDAPFCSSCVYTLCYIPACLSCVWITAAAL
jgi:hypothetical protein